MKPETSSRAQARDPVLNLHTAEPFLKFRSDFPILLQKNRGKALVYLDSAASAQKPKQVIDAISDFYTHDYANIHRGIYELSERATAMYEQARDEAKRFLNAEHACEIVFVRSTTEAINLVAQTFAQQEFTAEDEIILSVLEHHSNIVPWAMLKERLGIELKIVPMTDEGTLDLTVYQNLFSKRTRLVALTHVSNTLGTINPVNEITRIAHAHDVPVLLDGAQAVSHVPVDVRAINCDFYAFSGHKLYGPTGIGVLYGKKQLLEAMPPYQGGGSMIGTVAFDKVTYAQVPQRFEAGTPDIAGAVGLAAAIRYVKNIGMDAIFAHEQELLHETTSKLSEIPGLKIFGTAHPKVGLISFTLEDIHPHDLATILDHEGITVRAGHHCTMPLMERLQVPATVRVSFGVYNHLQEIDRLIEALLLAKRTLG